MNIGQLIEVYKGAYEQAFLQAAGVAPACHSGTDVHGSEDTGENAPGNVLRNAGMDQVESWREPLNNQHVMQAVLPNNLNCGYSVESGMEFQRLLLPDAPQREYKERGEEMTSTCHWGQRKLLLSEIEFMTMFPHHTTVVYAGAAPGTHIPYLSSLFPKTHFVLFDPANFTCQQAAKISIRNEMFTDKIASEFYGQDVLFISDIRVADFHVLNFAANESQIAQDMENQMKWHQLMNPIASILKFRLPWDKNQTEYLTGDIKLPVWGPQRTTEARLIVKRDAGMRKYDDLKYEQQMSSFNTHTRVAIYPHTEEISDVGDSLYCHCYDCVAEIRILEAYLKMHGVCVDASVIKEMASKIDIELAPRKRMDPALDREDHYNTNCAKQWVYDMDGKLKPGCEIGQGKTRPDESDWQQVRKKKKKMPYLNKKSTVF